MMQMHDDTNQVVRLGEELRRSIDRLHGLDASPAVEAQYMQFQQLARTLAPSQRRLRRAAREWAEAAVRSLHSGRQPWWMAAEEAAFRVFVGAAGGRWDRAANRAARGLTRAAVRTDDS